MSFRTGVNFLLISLISCAVLIGCSKESYPEHRLKEDIAKICRKEYGIDKIDVKIVGQTIGVYLPLPKLFATDDFKGAVAMGKVRHLESLFEPSPEAMEKVEDVLFTISRVILSTDKDLKFYILQVTDVEKTGLELILFGYVNDVKRVRVWDIPRSEYRKRIIHELRLNRAVLWHRPVREFFKDLSTLNGEEVQTKYFGPALSSSTSHELLLRSLLGIPDNALQGPWDIVEMRSAMVQKNEVLVYVKASTPQLAVSTEDMPQERIEEPSELQYLFMIEVKGETMRIMKIIPFQYLDEEMRIQKIPFPPELQIEESLDSWETEFPVEEILTGPFLAQQLTRRSQGLIANDERIQNTFRNVRLIFKFEEHEEESFFSLELDAMLRDMSRNVRESVAFHEDMLYLLEMISREFVNVLRSYRFGEFSHLSLNLAQESTPWILGRDNLELFRRKKLNLTSLLSLTQV